MNMTRRKFTKEDVENMDFSAYLASSSEDEESDEDLETSAAKYKKLLAELSNDNDGNANYADDVGEEGEGNMEITFTPGLSEAVTAAKDKKQEESEEEEVEETTIEAYKRKAKEKRMKKKLAKQNAITAKGKTIIAFDSLVKYWYENKSILTTTFIKLRMTTHQKVKSTLLIHGLRKQWVMWFLTAQSLLSQNPNPSQRSKPRKNALSSKRRRPNLSSYLVILLTLVKDLT
jgi:hypothetical protein